jgi:hypothetical protein
MVPLCPPARCDDGGPLSASDTRILKGIAAPMVLVIHLAWILIIACRYAGIIAIYAGVALFGVYFISGNARSRNNAVPLSAWLGVGPRKGMKIAAIGAALLLFAWALQLFLPNGT